MKRKAQDTVIALLTSEYPAFGALSHNAKKALAETYRLRGPKAFQVAFEHLAVESLDKGEHLPCFLVQRPDGQLACCKEGGCDNRGGDSCRMLAEHLRERKAKRR